MFAIVSQDIGDQLGSYSSYTRGALEERNTNGTSQGYVYWLTRWWLISQFWTGCSRRQAMQEV